MLDYSRTGCAAATASNRHAIEWLEVPAMEWVGGSDFGGHDTPAMRRGYCLHCERHFVAIDNSAHA